MLYGMPALIEFDTIGESLALCRRLGLDFIELNMNLPQYRTQALRENLVDCRKMTEETGVFFTLHLDENLNFDDTVDFSLTCDIINILCAAENRLGSVSVVPRDRSLPWGDERAFLFPARLLFCGEGAGVSV